MTADEMFEELGYKLIKNNKEKMVYKSKDQDADAYITFYSDKLISCGSGGFYDEAICIDLNELKAINKKVEELQWN